MNDIQDTHSERKNKPGNDTCTDFSNVFVFDTDSFSWQWNNQNNFLFFHRVNAKETLRFILELIGSICVYLLIGFAFFNDLLY